MTELLLQRMQAAARGSGAHFVVVYVPARFEVRDADWEAAKRVTGLKDDLMDRGMVLRRLQAVGVRQGFDVVDPTAELRLAEGWFSSTYHRNDIHWNVAGYRVVARVVAQALSVGAFSADGAGRP